MTFVTVCIKLLIVLVFALLPIIPLGIEYLHFLKDKEKKISHKRFRLMIFSVIYVVALTIFFLIQQQIIGWISSLAFVQWLAMKLSVSDRFLYCTHVFAAVALNLFIGVFYRLAQHFVRIGLKKKNLAAPNKKGGGFSLLRRIERRILFFFNREFFFFVGRIIKGMAFGLTVTYTVLFVLFQLPAVFSAGWIPYGALKIVFDAGNVCFLLTLLILWETALFLEGVSLLEKECPDLISKTESQPAEDDVDLNSIDKVCKKEYHDFFFFFFNLSNDHSQVNANNTIIHSSDDEKSISESIVKAIENDSRMPGHHVEIYKKCVEQLIEHENRSFIINGNFFDEFSAYFFRYLSMICARGDNIAIICNSIHEAKTVYAFVDDGFSKISSLYSRRSQKEISFDDPIWKIHLIADRSDLAQRNKMQDASVIITTLPFICSKDFEYYSGSFIQLLHTVIFTCALETVNQYSDQLTAMNERFINIVENNARKSKSSESNPGFRIRYKSLPIRYIAFDDARIPGLDKALKNLLHINFESTDIMVSNSKAMVRLYNNEPVPNEKGIRVFPDILNTTERLGTVVNMAVIAAKAGAKQIFIYENGSVPFENYRESLNANIGRVKKMFGNVNIRINEYSYFKTDKAVVIVFDEKCNLPETIRKYLSLFGNTEILLMIFSKMYLYRDYYIDNISKVYQGCQYSRIPFYEGVFRDIARRILLKADSGGVTVSEIFGFCSALPEFHDDIARNDVNAILRRVLKEFGICQDDYVNIYEFFEYSYSNDFDEKGAFDPVDKITLRHTGQYYDMVNALDGAVLLIDQKKYSLPISKLRISQNYIEGQNLIFEGNIYKIDRIDTAKGEIAVRLASGGNNDETVEYIQDREYIAYLSDGEMTLQKSKHIIISSNSPKASSEEKSIRAEEIFLDTVSFPMEVVTKGYYLIDPNTMTLNYDQTKYLNIFEGINERICKQVYRRYGYVEEPFFSTDDIVSETELNAANRQAQALILRIKGSFGEDSDRLSALAGVMLNETLKMIYPSIADCIAVCPIYRDKETITSKGKGVLAFYPDLIIKGDLKIKSDELAFMIIEDCQQDAGLLYSLTESGDDILNTIFRPIRDYLEWLKNAVDGSRYLYFGMDKMPYCFDTEALLQLTEEITESNVIFDNSVSEQIEDTDVCDFCRRKLPKSLHDVIEGKDGRVMCSKCRNNIVGNSKKLLAELVEKAKLFIESTYSIRIDPGNHIRFESTEKIIHMIKKGEDHYNRGNDLPLMSFIDKDSTIHVEYDIPAFNILELLVRELVQYWQITEAAKTDNEMAEGHIAFVTIQFLNFAGNPDLYRSMLSYYESTKSISGIGYRKLIKALAESDQYRDNPFFMLMADNGQEVTIPKRVIAGEEYYGLPYKPEKSDRCGLNELRYYYYDHIPDRLKPYYDVLFEAAKAHQTEVEFTNAEKDDIFNAMKAMRNDHPELFWVNQITAVSSVGNKMTATVDYGAGKDEIITLQQRLEEAVKPFLEDITPEMSAYDVLLRLHVKMINHIDYDSMGLDQQDQTGGPEKGQIDSLRQITGALLEGKAVCAGYAKTMQYLANLCGIECTYCLGRCHGNGGKNDSYHGWNVVKLDGDYYHLDVTWCDQSNTIQTIKDRNIGFKYFCVTTDEIGRSRDIDKKPIVFPAFKSTKCNYYVHNGLYLDSYDLKKIEEMSAQAVRNGKRFVEFKCASKSVYDAATDKLFKTGSDVWKAVNAAKAIDKTIGSSCTYSCDKKMLMIRIDFNGGAVSA